MTCTPPADAPGTSQRAPTARPTPAEPSQLAVELERAERALHDALLERATLLEQLRSAREDPTYRLARRIHLGARRLLPHGTRRGSALAVAVRGALIAAEHGPAALLPRLRARIVRRRPSPPPVVAAPGSRPALDLRYQEWLSGHLPDAIELELMRIESESWAHRPLVSIIMPVCNTPIALLEEAIRSVRLQTYSNWELCIADDASTEPDILRTLDEAAAADSRIRVARCEEHRGIAATSNAALELATGDCVAFLDHDDALRRHALHRLIEPLQVRDDIGVIYSDEDKLLVSDQLGEPFFKPGWSPDLLLSGNFLCHVTLMRRDLVTEVGGFRPGFEGAQDHDLYLRVTELAGSRGLAVAHVPHMLYIWRQVPGSAALSTVAKPHAYTAGRRAVQEALERRGLEGSVAPGPSPGWYHVRYALRTSPSVAVVIPTRDRLDLLDPCIRSLEAKTTYARYSVVIVDNDSHDPATLSYLEGTPHLVLREPGEFNYSRIMNRAIAGLDAEHVVLLNNDVEVISPDWLEALLEHSQQPDVGAVGCRLVYPDGRPQHEGVGVGVGGPAVNLDLSECFPLGRVVRQVSAVTGACMMVRKAVYAEMGGLDECLRVAFNDVDLCLRLQRAGYRVMYTPHAELMHHESATRGRPDVDADEDDFFFAARWGHHRRLRDRHLSPYIACASPLILRQG